MGKERPIIFTAESVKAILEGRKTMTRRVINPQPKPCRHSRFFTEEESSYNAPSVWQGQIIGWKGYKYEGREGWFCYICGNGLKHIDEFSAHGIICPHGQVGDRLWVRETHYKYGGWVLNGFTKTGRPHWEFQPMSEEVRYYDNRPEILCKNRRGLGWWKRPTMYLFKVDARITLEITEVRVERLQEISREDILAEGIEIAMAYTMDTVTDEYLRALFIALWNDLNAKRGYGWDKNPWVWVIKFDNIGVRVK